MVSREAGTLPPLFLFLTLLFVFLTLLIKVSILEPAMRQFQRITMNMVAEDTSYKTMDGKQYLVVPTVMLTEGVHAGSQGPLLYLNEHISKNPESWNHKPTVVYHPVQNGLGVSACTPDVIERQGCGLLMNTRFDDKLRTESWLDEAKTDKVDPRILPAIRNKQVLNGSTGLWHELKPEAGKWNSQDYLGIVTNMLPDHWAILPDQPGACKDAGLLRNEAIQGISYDDIRQQIYMAVKADANGPFKGPYTYVYIADVYQKYAIVEVNDVAYSISYSIKDGLVKIGGDYEPVRRVNTWLTVNGERLISNFLLSALPLTNNADNIIPKVTLPNQEPTMSQTNNNQNPPMLTPQAAVTTPQSTPTPTPTPVPVPAPRTPQDLMQNTQDIDAYIAAAPPQIGSLLRNALAAAESQKAQLIQVITANKANIFNPDWLKKQSNDLLQGMALLAGSSVPAQVQNAGLGGDLTPMLLSFPTNNAAAPPPEQEALPVGGVFANLG